MKKCFILTDFQNDFISLDGKLNCGEKGLQLDLPIHETLKNYILNDDLVLVLLDTHYKDNWSNHDENINFPLHCIKGTIGHEIFGDTGKLIQMNKSNSNIHFFEKNTYQIHDEKFNSIITDSSITQIEFAGVTSNICVVQNAINVYNILVKNNIKPNLIINEKCTVGTDENFEKQSLDYMRNILNFKIIKKDYSDLKLE